MSKSMITLTRPAGGAQYLHPSKTELGAMERGEWEEYILGDALSVAIGHSLDLNSDWHRGINEATGTVTRSHKITDFTLIEGSVSFHDHFYSDVSFREELGDVPKSFTFDQIFFEATDGEHCRRETHDLDRILRYFYSGLIRRCPNAWMICGELYSSEP